MADKEKPNQLDLTEKLVNEVNVKDEQAFLQNIRETRTTAYNYWDKNFTLAEKDVRFAGGEQWPQEIKQERELQHRPVLTLNDLPQYLDQVIGDQRQNRPGIQVAPGDGESSGGATVSTDGNTDYKTAEIIEGLIRNIEYTSKAEQHYDTAFQHAVESGFGWLRVTTAYESEKSFDLVCKVKSVRNRWAVLIDPHCQEPDFSDANYCFVFDEMPRHQFEENYPEATVGDLADYDEGWWDDGKRVRVAEYYQRVATRRKLLLLSNGTTVWHDEVKDVIDEMESDGVTIQRERMADTYKVQWWLVTGNSVLRGPIDIPCSAIPVVPVLGKETNIRGVSDYRGMIRNAIDAKRADNYWMSAATERVALAPKAPYLVTPKQIEGHEKIWNRLNTENLPYLPFNETANGRAPQRQAPAPMPVAELQMAAAMTDKVKSTIGMYNASLGAASNETSGKAILARQRESDVGSFVFIDNLSRAIMRIGKILTEMIPVVYDTNRIVRIRGESGKGDWVELNKEVQDEQSGKMVVINDLSMGSYDVVIKSGPSYTTQRAEAAESLMEFIRVVPSVSSLVIDKLAGYMDWPGADDIAERLRMTIPKQLLSKEDMDEMGDQPEMPPTPEQQATMADAEATMSKAKAETAMAEAKTLEAQAKMAEINAQAQGGGDMMQMVKHVVAEAMAEVLAATGGNHG